MRVYVSLALIVVFAVLARAGRKTPAAVQMAEAQEEKADSTETSKAREMPAPSAPKEIASQQIATERVKSLGFWPPELQRRAAASRIHVLAADLPEQREVFLVDKPNFYSLTSKLESTLGTVHLEVAGTQIPKDAKPMEGAIPGDRNVRGFNASTTINEGIRTISWTEGEVAYSIDVECSHAKDPYCLSEEFALETANGLKGVGDHHENK